MATCISNNAVEITRKDNPGYRAIDAMNETIANIVYEYQRIVESDDAWPSAQYVQDKLRGEPFKASKEQQELYNLLGLSETKTFTSEAQRDAFIEKYLKNNGTWVFPESSVTMYRGVKGDYKLSVGLPTTKNNVLSSVEAEMEYIKQRAIADGTFMKVTSGKNKGKKSNLNERQWLQVRTKAFKRWFGDWENDPENASKVVDENGEPKVVYHGTSRKLQDNKFNTEFIFASNSEYVAAGYGFQRKGISPGIDYALSNFVSDDITLFREHIDRLIEEVTRDIRLGDIDPFYEEGDLERNKALLDSLLDARELVKERDIFKEFEFNIFHVFSNIKNPLIVDAKGKYWHSIEFENDIVSTNKLANIAKERGYDGCIIKNVIDKGAEVAGNYSDISDDYIANNPNQIKSATDNVGTFSTERDEIDQNIIRNTLSELEYIDMLDELELSEDKTSSFLDNFLNKILLVNPRDKVRRNYSDFAYQRLSNNTPEDFRYKLLDKIFGFKTTRINKVLGAKKESFLSDVRDQLSHWKSDLIDVINDPKLGRESFNDMLSKLYTQRNEIKENIELLQRVLDSNVSFTFDDVFDNNAMSAKLPNFTKLEINTVSRLLPLHKETISRRMIAFKLQVLKRNLDDKLKEIKRTQYAKYQITLAAKNRLVAINTIPNLFDLVEKRLELEYDSQVLSKEQIDKELSSKKPLYDAIQKAIDTHKLDNQGQPLFNEKEQRECSYEELRDKILETNPEFKGLLELLRKANPKLKIKVGGDPNVNEDGSYEGGVFRMKENELVLPNIADVYSAVHELVHSGTSYGIRMQRNEETDALEKQIDTFMNYIRDYIKSEQLYDYWAFTSTGVTSPDVYGFKNAAEFVAELFSNSSFQEFLSMVPPMKKKEFKSLLHEIWSNIIDFLNKLVGKKLDKSALDQAKKLGYAAMFLQQQHISDIYKLLEQIAEQEQGESLQNIIRQSDGSVDIHFTKGHNPRLSNFAPRTTTIDLSNFRTLDGTKQITFPSVEHAFQYMKFIAVQQMYSRQVKDGNKTKVVWTNQSRAEELQKAAQNVLTAPNGSSAKSKGLALRLTEQEQKVWDSYSPQLMKFLLQQSFAQNKGARDLLLATGDAKLTHSVRKPDKGPDWSTLFPQFLTEIRESYKSSQQNQLNQPNSEPNNALIQIADHKWTRAEAENDPSTLYIFTDNTNRTSGGRPVDPNSWYAKKYGTHAKYPTRTQAVLRGLDNAYPISTQRWYDPTKGLTYDKGNWTDADIEEFKRVIDAEFQDIYDAWNSGKYNRIAIGSILNGDISKITQARVPEIYAHLKSKIQELSRIVGSSGVDANKLSTKTEDFGVTIDKNLYSNAKGWLSKNPSGIVAYRKDGKRPSSFTPETVQQGWIGNPFSIKDKGPKTVQQFFDWIITGNNFGNELATEEFRQAVIDKILSTPADAPILYYKELGRPSHATVLGYLVHDKSAISRYSGEPNALKNAHLYSGGAIGADARWGEVAKEFGVQQTHYDTRDYDNLSQEKKAEVEQAYRKVLNLFSERKFFPASDYRGKLVRRDYLQAESADAVFAISSITNNKVDGGTGYAVHMAIDMGKPVHVFDYKQGYWFTWDGTKFIQEDTPILTPNFAGIGTRKMEKSFKQYGKPAYDQLADVRGTKAIRDVYLKTLKQGQTTQVQQSDRTDQTKPIPPESPSIVEQIVNLLRDQGVKVYGKTNLVDFLNTRGDKNIQKYLSKKARAEFEKLLLKKRPDMSKAEVDATLDFLHSLPNSKEDAAYVKTAIRWVLNDSIRLPEDNVRARQAFNEARKKHIDISKYRTLGELIVSDEMRPKEREKKPFNPNEAKSFTNKQIITTEGGRNYEVYDVEDSEQGLEDVCKAVSAHYSVSPWCVSTFTATGKPTESAKRMWSQHSSIPKKIAFLDGKPVAFSADSFNRNAYERGTLRDYNIQANDNGEYYIMQPDNGEISLSEVQPLIDEGLIKAEEDPFGIRSNLYRLTIQGKMEASFEHVALPIENWWGLNNWNPQPELNDDTNIDPNAIGTGQQLANQEFMEEMQAELEWEWQQQLEEEARIAEQERAYWAERWIGNDVGYDPHAEIREYQNDETYNKILQNVPFITEYLRDGQLFYPYQEALRDLVRRGYDENTITEALLNETADSIIVAEDLPFYQTEEGEIYGFVDEDNSMYLDETVITPEHPIHEFTHIWDRIVQEKQPELWKQGVELMRQIDLWDEVLNSEQYGQKWADLTEEERTNRIASEVHSRLTGKEGERILNEIAEKEGKANIISKLKRWLKEVWMSLRETFGSAWTEQELAALTLKDFTQLTLRDLTEGTLKDFLTKQEKKSVVSEETDIPIGVKELTELKQDKEYQKDALLLNQFEKLTKEHNIPMSTIDEAAVDIANWISDQISDIMKDPSIAKQLGIDISEDEIKTMSRIDVIKKLTPNALFEWCKNDRFLHNEDIDIDDIELAQQLQNMAECWDFLVQRSLMTILENEKVAITVGDSTSAMTVTEITDDIDVDNPADIAEQEAAEETGENQQEWGIENKTVDLLGTATAAVRDELRRCYVLDEDGDKVLTDRGVFKRIPMREALNSLQRWVEGSQKLSDAVAKLETKVDKNPWLADLISKLKDPNYEKLQSEMWQVLNAPFINYWVVVKKDGKFITTNVNSRPALKEAVNNIQAIYSAGIHPLFTLDGVNTDHFNTLKEESELLNKEVRPKVEALQKEGKDITEDEDLFKQAVGSIGIALNILGYSAPAELVMENLTNEAILNTASTLSSIVWTIDRHKNNRSYNPFAYLDVEGKQNKGSIKGYLNQLLSPLTESLEDTAITCFYDNGKMYQSRVKPSFLTLQMQNFHLQGEDFKEFIRQNYAELPWFRDQDESFEVDWTKGWRNPLLERLITNQEARDHFRHKVQLNFNKKQYMKGMNPSQYIMSSITEFVAGMESSDKGLTYSYIRIPIQSNKPSSEYIMMEVFTGNTYQDDITYRLKMIFDQEMSRISTVRKRNYERGKDDGYIDGFDSVGRKFCFLDFMNYFLDTTRGKNSRLGKLLERKLEGKKETQLNPDEESEFLDLVTKEIKARMNSRTEKILAEWDKEGIIKAAESISNIGPVDQIRETLKKFLWNDSLGAMNIMELFVGDIAFYEDADTLQKRLAELHAPGIRPNTEVKYQGKNITDGKFRAVQLADFELDAKEFKTNILENVKTVFERKIAEAPDSEKQAWVDLLDHLTNEETGLFVTDINVTDGQAFNCPTSYMKKARMYGKWSDAQEAVLQKIRKGEKYTWADVKNAFSTPTFATTKPTVYGNAVVDTGVRESGTLDKISVPTYFKNSEYTIMLADAILQGEDTGRPNMLRAIFNVMEQSHWRKDANGEDVYQNDGIDTIQFISAVKSGVGKTVDLVQFLNNPNGEKLAEEYLKQQIYLDPTNDKIPNGKNYNLHTVRELPFESYAIQMDVSNHFLEHEQIHGSQNRMIIPSELAETDAEGNTVYYDTPQGKKTAKEFGEIYEKTIGANIQQSIEELQEMLGLPVDGSNENQLSTQSTLKKNLAISKILKREIMSNPRYGLDLYFACSIDPETGGFRIPLGDPVQSKRIEQLLNSVIKNKINKQKIAGGPVVQVTNFGTSKNLNIRFKNKNKPGELLMTRSEFFEKNGTTSDKAYKDYIDKNQGGIAHFEVYASASTKKLFEHFADKDGNIDIGAIEMVNPDLLKMIGYRIPTEAKYSITPMRIVGFLPREAGEAIMMPYEITLLNGSDFDVDKMYLMTKVFDIEKAGEFYDFELTEPNWKAEKRLANQINKFMSNILNSNLENSNGEVTAETLNRFMSRHKDWQGYQEALKKYGEVKQSRRKAWNQVVLDMMNAAKTKYELSEAQKNLINQTVDSRKELTAEQKEQDKKELISIITDKTLRDKAISFLRGGYRENSHYDDAITREFRKVFLKALYRTKDPMDTKKLRDNQIIDMSWSVLTHETTAHELLNPGGFDPQKKMGYVMAILKDPANEGKYDYYDLMKNYSLGELRKLASSNTSLMFFDGQAKYYRQNSAAGSLTGIFAVHRTAHAVLERDNLQIHLAGLLGSKRDPFKPFNIAGVDFDEYMKIDTRFDRLGNSIGKILGSLVAAAVDAGKYPVLNLSNINNETANVCVSMIKLGMTFEDTALFLSQKVIDDLLARHSTENIDGYKSLQNLVNEELAELEKSSKIDKKSPLWTDNLTQEDLIDGLLDTNVEHTYRVLSAFKKMLKIADAMRLPTAATRYNSISSAVGPQIINNIIAEKKIQKMNSKSFIYKEESIYTDDPALSVEDIINLHPILRQFYRANSIAKQVFKGMPTSSNGFDSVIDSVVAMGLDDNIFNDTKLMSGLSDFYQTYLLYKTGVIKHSELYHYINEFPTEFITKKIKDKYPDNKFIQAINYNKDKAGRVVLEITTTGMDQSAKSPLMSAWWDLYNVDRKLATDLFKYCIYRGGVGFNPKTFMNLVPVFLKEVIPGYTDTYNKLPRLDVSEPQVVLDMFVQNNYNNGKLVTNMTKEFNTNRNLYLTQEKHSSGVMQYSPSDYEMFADVPYFRLNDKIYKQVYNDKMYHILQYIELPILGNDRNYVEVLISNERPVVSTVDTTSDFDNFDTREDSDVADPSNTFDTADEITTDRTEDTRTVLEKQRDTPTAIDLFIDAEGDPNIGASRYTAWKQAPKSIKDANREKLDKFFTERLRIRGIEANKELLDELFNQLC